jgi:hypothetical protein
VGSRFSNGTFTPSAADGGKWFTITATSVKAPAMYAECKVYVPATGSATIVGEDGNVYVYVSAADDNTYQMVDPDGTLSTTLYCPVTPGQPGMPTDRTNILTKYGAHWLIEGACLYHGVGADAKLGTSDDSLVYDNGSAMIPSATSVSITVSPASVKVTKGETVVLSANVTLNGTSVADPQTVTWSVIGTHNAGTTITTPGATATLSAATAESATTLTVRVTYPGVGTRSVDVSVGVVSNFPITPGAKTYTDSNGIVWKILKDNRPASGTAATGGTSDGSGTVLLLTDKIYGTGSTGSVGSVLTYHISVNYVQYPASLGTYRTFMNTFYQTYVGAELKAKARIPNLTYETGWNTAANTSFAYSSAGAAAGATTTGITFPLSISEANQYLGAATSGKVASTVRGTAFYWWLRSPGSTSTQVAYVYSNGAVRSNSASSSSYARVALWVSAN